MKQPTSRGWSSVPVALRVAVGTFLFWLGGLWLSYGLGRFELFVDGRSVRLDSWEFLTHAARVHGTFWLCSMAALWLASRACREGVVRWRTTVLGTLLLAVLWSGEIVLASPSLGEALRTLIGVLPTSVLQVGAFVAVGIGWQLWRRGQLRERELQQAQLRALRSQLQPHFLFNTLHAIGVTATRDGATAARMTVLLGDLLRHSLRERRSPLVSLADEVELLQPYLQLQQLRFADRMRVQVDVPESLQDAMVPDLLLQPLVENALQHGIEQRPGAGVVHIRAARDGDGLLLEVRDDGVPVDAAVHEGTGLQATRQRLQTLFGDRASLTLAPNPQGGTTATIRLPFTEARHAA
jgi:hypothetical protein